MTIVSRAVAPDGVVDIFPAAGLQKPDVSVLSEEFLDEVRGMRRPNGTRHLEPRSENADGAPTDPRTTCGLAARELPPQRAATAHRLLHDIIAADAGPDPQEEEP